MITDLSERNFYSVGYKRVFVISSSSKLTDIYLSLAIFFNLYETSSNICFVNFSEPVSSDSNCSNHSKGGKHFYLPPFSLKPIT
ncbi:MAG: hypothetical protein ACI9VO_002381 [Colwellia sp.]|jgi:hypothetical protein